MADGGDDRSALTSTLTTEALKEAGQHLLGLLVQRATEAASQRVAGFTDRLTDVTASGGDIRSALGGGRSREDGRGPGSNNGRGGLTGALGGLKEKVATAISGGGGGGGSGATKLKMTTIVETLDIALPLRTTYNLWTQFEDFPGFMKKVETVEQETDEKTNWTAKVFVSRRTWEATIIEQVPDSHIVWRSTGAKGHVDGAVTFTEVGPNLTRVLLVMEYWPKGLFEQTGNLWRAQGRRARLEFKHFRRHAMTNVILRQEEVEGWRGEIRDSEVVRTHEEALKEEQQEGPESAGERTADREETAPEEAGPEESAPRKPSPTSTPRTSVRTVTSPATGATPTTRHTPVTRATTKAPKTRRTTRTRATTKPTRARRTTRRSPTRLRAKTRGRTTSTPTRTRPVWASRLRRGPVGGDDPCRWWPSAAAAEGMSTVLRAAGPAASPTWCRSSSTRASSSTCSSGCP